MFRRAAVVVVTCALLFGRFTVGTPAGAQTGSGEIHGTVTDPSGALIPSATIILTGPQGPIKTASSGRDGAYRLTGIAPGTYSLDVSAEGFAPLTASNIVVSGKAILHNLTLEIPVEQQQVEVTETTTGVNTVAEGNASSIVIKGSDLNALSDDPDQLQSELQELAGPSAGPNGAQFFIDGFSGGQLPPKSSIREIRVNQNPFSAQFDKLGYGRIEILTKPGTDKLHGNIMISGNDSTFNSMNPFVTTQPPYYSTFINGGIGGSLNSKTSWYFSMFRRNNATNSIINAQLWDWTTGTSYNYATAVAAPTSRLDINPRMDFQLGSKNTLTIRYMMDRQIQTNSGVSNFSLESQGYNVTNYEHTIQISDSQVVRSNIVNETRFQYARETTNRTPVNTTSTVTVQSAFTGGGNNQGTSRDLQNRFELQNFTTIAAGQHAIQFGGRFRWSYITNASTAGFNGAFTYMSLDAYSLHRPSQYTITTGKSTTTMTALDAGLFYQDDFKFNQNLTLSYGLRFEAQNYLSERGDWAPRVSMAWAPWGTKGKTVIRAGYGWFFDRFGSTNILNSIRLDGVSQMQYVINTPSFYEGSVIPAPSDLSTVSTKIAPTIYQLSPDLRSSLNMQAAAGIERQWGKFATTSVTYVNSRGVHQYLSENVNAFIPGTYNQQTGTGTRALGGNSNIYQYQSGGIYKQNQLMASYSIRSKAMSLFGFYVLTFANSNTSGASYFSSDPFNPSADFGRASFDVRHRLMFGGTLKAPFGVSLNPMLEATSGSPFDITVGQDLNGDSKFNDRPAWATSSTDPRFRMDTAYGSFNLNPDATAARIPYNMGSGPSQFGINLRLNKSFGIGPKVEGGTQNSGFRGGGPRGGGGRGPGGGGLGPGGLSGNMGAPGGSQVIARKYALVFTAQARNLLNHVNLAPPVGTLQSPFFGTSTRLAGGPWSNSSANRSIELQLSFNF